MFDWKTIASEASGEIIERYFHERFSEYIKEGIANGENTNNILIKAIMRLRQSGVLKLVQDTLGTKATGLAITGLGAGIAAWIQKTDWGNFMPNEKGLAMTQIRFALQNLAPRILVGGAEALGDGFEDHVKASVSAVVSDDTACTKQRRGAIDSFFRPNLLDGKDHGCFMYVISPSGEIQHDTFNTPRCKGKKFRELLLMWRKDDPSKKMEGDDISLSEFIGSFPFDIDQSEDQSEILTEIREELTKKSLTEKKVELTSDGKLFKRLLAEFASKKSPLEQKLAIDLAKDIANDSTKINELAASFLTDTNRLDGLTQEDFMAIQIQLQMWCGSTLTNENKFRLAFDHAKHVFGNTIHPDTGAVLNTAERLERAVGVLVHKAGAWTVYLGVTLVTVFVTALILFLFGGFFVDVANTVPNVPEKTLSWSWIAYTIFSLPTIVFGMIWVTRKTGSFTAKIFRIPIILILVVTLLCVFVPVWNDSSSKTYAVAVVSLSILVMIAEMLLCTIVEASFSLPIIQFVFKNFKEESLKDKGRMFCTIIGIVGALVIGLILLGTTQLERPAILGVLVLLAIAINFGLTATGAKDEANKRTQRTLRFVGWIGIGIVLLVLAPVVISIFGWHPRETLNELFNRDWFQAVMLGLALFVFLLLVIVLLIHFSMARRENGTVEWFITSKHRSLSAFLLLIALGLSGAVGGWYYMKKDAETKNRQAGSLFMHLLDHITTPAPAPVVSSPILPVQKQPAVTSSPIPTPFATTKHTVHRRHREREDEAGSRFEDLTPGLQEAILSKD